MEPYKGQEKDTGAAKIKLLFKGSTQRVSSVSRHKQPH